MRLLLDTVTFIWATRSPELLSRRAFSALSDASAVRELSSVSISEIGIKQSTGKLDLGKKVVLDSMDDLKIHILRLTEDHAFGLFDLPRHHSDPFDRQIIAQAMVEGIPVVTPDAKFGLYKGLDVLW
jgi:PIN domain nuclease of toxin-antitoxin system